MNVKKWKIDEYDLSLTEIGAVKRGEDVIREYPDGTTEVLPFEELGYKPDAPVPSPIAATRLRFRNCLPG